jgi:hypothetical protein
MSVKIHAKMPEIQCYHQLIQCYDTKILNNFQVNFSFINYHFTSSVCQMQSIMFQMSLLIKMQYINLCNYGYSPLTQRKIPVPIRPLNKSFKPLCRT